MLQASYPASQIRFQSRLHLLTLSLFFFLSHVFFFMISYYLLLLFLPGVGLFMLGGDSFGHLIYFISLLLLSFYFSLLVKLPVIVHLSSRLSPPPLLFPHVTPAPPAPDVLCILDLDAPSYRNLNTGLPYKVFTLKNVIFDHAQTTLSECLAGPSYLDTYILQMAQNE